MAPLSLEDANSMLLNVLSAIWWKLPGFLTLTCGMGNGSSDFDIVCFWCWIMLLRSLSMLKLIHGYVGVFSEPNNCC